MWSVYNQAIAYHRSPSTILNIANHWLAYQLDEAVLFFGRFVEGKLNERDDKGKQKYTIREIFDGNARPASFLSLMPDDVEVFDI